MPDLLCKICGLTRPEDLLLCHSMGTDVTGFIFAPGSPRFISPEAARALPRGPGMRAGVFVNAEAAYILRCARTARLDYIQLHGGESPDFCRDLGPERVIKTLWPQSLSSAALQKEMERYAPVCAWFLLDAGQSWGGSGKSLDFKMLEGIQPPRPWFLSGGLGPHNLAAAFRSCAPDGVDCNSALENAPGVKDHERLRAALALVRDLREQSRRPGIRGTS
ncbi:MAG: phosphoribosylanthranilate isomerase [Desulfovibrio sp.]|nr:phosphoribosylanthranilate isomerase [Desulfovibrio sp.]